MHTWLVKKQDEEMKKQKKEGIDLNAIFEREVEHFLVFKCRMCQKSVGSHKKTPNNDLKEGHVNCSDCQKLAGKERQRRSSSAAP